MKNYLLLFFSICILLIAACEKDTDTDVTTDNKSTDTSVHEDSSDYSWDASAAVNIKLNISSISVESPSAIVSGNTVTITSAGIYSISGTLTDGQIIVNTEDEEKVVLILNGAHITSSKSAPIYISKAKKAIVYITEDTENSLTDASTYVYASSDVDEPNAALYSKSDLTIFGEGSLAVKGNFNDGITGKDGLIVKSGNITVNSLDDGIIGKDYLIIKDGTFVLNCGGDGIKSSNEESTALGYVTIESGKIKVVSGGDAIAAQTDVLITSGEFNLTSGGGSSKTVAATLSSKGIKGKTSVFIEDGTFTINSADDGIHSNNEITVNKGVIAISSSEDGMHADSKLTINDGDITIAKSYEGIESGLITVVTGKVSITASDDGFNASYGKGGESNDGSSLNLKGGNIFVNGSGGDGLDSNGNIEITGGTIVVNGPQSSPEVGMDYNGTCKITDGFLIISGTNSNMTQAPGTSSSQYSLKAIMTSSIAANTLFHIQDADGNDVVTFRPVRSYYSMVFSSPALKKGATYYIYTGGSSTGTLTNCIYKDGNYTAGTLVTSFTVSSVVTSYGNSGSGSRG